MRNKLTKWQKVFKTTKVSNLKPGTYSYECENIFEDKTANAMARVAEALFLFQEPVQLVGKWNIYDVWVDTNKGTIVFHISIDEEEQNGR